MIMEKYDFLQNIRATLETEGFSANDLVQFCTEEDKIIDDGGFPFEVVYEDLVRSRFPREGKKPLGVICEKTIITLKDYGSIPILWSPKYFPFTKIKQYECTAGKISFWKKLVCNPQKQKALDDLLVQLGGEPISGKWYWSETPYNERRAWAWNFSCHYQSHLHMWNARYVRMVLDFSELKDFWPKR